LSNNIFIGIDLGSSGVRIEVYDIDGNLIAEGHEVISKQDTDEWLMAIAKLCLELHQSIRVVESMLLLSVSLVHL